MRKLFAALLPTLSIVAMTACLSARAAGIDELPKQVQDDLYDKSKMDPAQPVGPSAYRDWHPKRPPPWTIGFASSYAGNTWRADEMRRLQTVLIPKWKKLGLLKDVVITQSNLNDSVQIQQMRQLVDRGVDAIIVCCSNPTALNQTVNYAHARNVPVFSATGYLESPYSVNSSANFVVGGTMLGDWMIKQLNGKGNVLVVEGIPGASASDSQNLGISDALKTAPDIKVVGNVAGQWTDQIAQAEIQKWLATHPEQLDGIIIQSASELGAVRAMSQSGRKMPPISIGGELGALCYWRKHPDFISTTIQAWPPGADFEMAWNIMMRTLEGQGPKVQSILTSPQKLDFDQLKTILQENCDEDSGGWYNVDMAQWAGKDYLDQFFLRPADPEQFKAKH